MKLMIIGFLSVVAFVACGDVPPPFNKVIDGKNCYCREKECTDVSCEEKNCVCLVKAIKGLQNQKDGKYPKKWLSAYLQLVQERCLCIQGCQNICNPNEFIECSSAAFDRFQCRYQKWLHGIAGDEGYEEFVSDINKILTDCINKDCKPICSGDGDCNPFFIPTKDCLNTKKCVTKGILQLAKKLEDESAAELLKDFKIYSEAYYNQIQICEESKKPTQRAICLDIARSEIERSLQVLLEQLVKSVGSCSAVSIVSALKQLVAECASKKK
ncbi:uncharacterized protein LOC116348312 [Contarinia nasturtii]|uniref:uncharacterized protein LOC116348312 n=1 Tax=Contarinia nasturtii TaxID=265458 RepID=UPI0012D4C025|nr:uncharacterized protein LOC116348312 [Contarinia nasturtii]